MRDRCAPTEPSKGDQAAEEAGEETETAQLPDEAKSRPAADPALDRPRGNYLKKI